MDEDQKTGRDRRPDTSDVCGNGPPDPSERQRRIEEARVFALRTRNDPREAAVLDELEAIQADNALP